MFNFYDKVLHKLGQEKGKETIFINIGAMDGVMFDDTAGYVSAYEYKSIYVEPVSSVFEKLKQNIKDPRAILENCAISEYDGVIQMVTIDHAPIERGEVHPCYYGMSAVYPPRNGLSSEDGQSNIRKYGKFIVVPCMTLNSLFEKHNVEHFDILSIDTEGHDWKVLKQLDLTKYRPSVIRAEYINLTPTEQEELCTFFSKNKYIFEIEGQNIDAVPLELYQQLTANTTISTVQPTVTPSFDTLSNKEVTIVTGLWNFNRDELSSDFKRTYDEYRQKFSELLKTPSQMFIYISKNDEDFIWQHRSRENTFIRHMESSEFETFFEFYDKVQTIRTNREWFSQASWLENSPQAKLKYYNPMVMSKMFLLNNATLFNPFNSQYFYWIDAGISSTVHPGYFSHDKIFDALPKFSDAVDSFSFISYPYIGGEEIHGFPRKHMERYCDVNYVNYVCRGGFFGGKKEYVNQVNSIYYNLLNDTLAEGLMGTEESLFTIIAHTHPDVTSRFQISEDGLIWPFFEKLKNVDKMILELPPKEVTAKSAKVNLYVLGFNSPDQFKSVVESIKSANDVMFNKCRKILINNSTDYSTFDEYDRLCQMYSFEEIHRDNLGVCGGRQYAAEHFAESDANFYMFFEDDMLLNDKTTESETCRNGFRKYIPNLYDKLLGIMLKEKFDFLKFSFSEFYGDNSVQWAWYNVPQSVRTDVWPHYDKLPVTGTDSNAPKTKFDTIDYLDGVPYIKGEIYYSNWPQIVSREGNQKMFLETKWARPYEQTWMSHMFQMMKKNELTAGILLASPVTHDRFTFYEAGMRKES